jgi:hypothetical protein
MTPARRCDCGACRRCELWDDPGPLGQAYRDSLVWRGGAAGPTPPVPASPPPAPCPHFAPHAPAERVALGLPRDRDTGQCGLGYGTAAGVVCACFATPSGCRGCPREPPSKSGAGGV